MKFEDVLFCAFRYSLGRRTYIVEEVVTELISKWDELSEAIKKLIISEIEKAIERGFAGSSMDVDGWKKVLDHEERMCKNG